MPKAVLDVRVDRYVEAAPDFARPLLQHLRTMVHQACGDLEETMKWSRPFFLYRGQIVANMSAFKAHCSFGLWGPGMSEVLHAAGIAADEAGGSLGRLTCLADLPPDDELSAWLQIACRIAGEKAAGRKAKAPARTEPARNMPEIAKSELVVPPDLTEALNRVTDAPERFADLSRSCRKEYVDWIEEAKRAETRKKRIAEAVEWIAKGKRRNWKYEARPPVAV